TTSANTIWSQLGNSYTQVVDLSNIDNSRAFLPPGISEDPRSPHFFDQVALWVAGETRPAPLSREEVMKYAELVRILPSSVTEKSD
ncbi:MAG TPA: penicillin acylase family protein, partial [Mesotoga sp.]|nr:penicillin acylase family protein [Mesotoga sp.]